MKSNMYRAGAAALALVVCLSLAPIATAARPGDRFDVREKIAKILKKLKSLPGIWVMEDVPGPPKP
jgi:hypothetical protein